ncbi:type II toxin-antitoxin system VapC family toxin [Candidatus Gottesmanbacteria bacterium]|nr:type II toxin-antitoxin system VapC family toxin [Candidatus Gottesmanbacteria bacterium]
MEKVIVDTSVIVKWFIEEKESPRALKLLNDYKNASLKILLPEITGLELANALFFGADFRGKLLQQVLSLFYSLQFLFVPIDKPLLIETVSFMERFKITSYDALFIALA